MKRIVSKDFYYQITDDAIIDEPISGKENVALVLQDDWTNASGKEFILRVLKAIGLEPQKNIQIIPVEEQQQISPMLRTISAHYTFLLFGCKSNVLGLNIDDKKHFWYEMQNASVLLAERPSFYNSDTVKKELWLALKQKFTT